MVFKRKTKDSMSTDELEKSIKYSSVDMRKILKECRNYLLENETRIINQISRNQVDKKELRNVLRRYLLGRKIEEKKIENILDSFELYIFKYAELNELIEDDDISDIKILSKDITRIKKNGKRYTSDLKFESNQEVNNLINFIAVKNQVNLSNINAIQVVTDKESYDNCILRINISTQYINSAETAYLHIRKIPKSKKDLDKLQDVGMITKEEKEYLREKIKKGCSIVLTGKGASGKSTMLNALIDEIPFDKSGLVIQESEELFTNKHPDMMFQKVRYNKGEGRVQYTLKDLAINGLLVDLDYFIIGEIKGGEALYFLNASYTGHACISTVHGNNSHEALNKLADYIKYESDYSRNEILSMLKDIDVIVYMKDFQAREISETKGYDYENQKILYNTVFDNHVKINNSCEKLLKKISS